ncbi:hypothetical protein BDZ91DRAFT_747409 [Kalaharituber pfeilii]|nr:hypothetical protein BDZ91DRAFT_747409 [Kalaharituber pfeilii]
MVKIQHGSGQYHKSTQPNLEQMRGMEQRILGKLSRIENNNLARLFNSRISHKTHQLEPL